MLTVNSNNSTLTPSSSSSWVGGKKRDWESAFEAKYQDLEATLQENQKWLAMYWKSVASMRDTRKPDAMITEALKTFSSTRRPTRSRTDIRNVFNRQQSHSNFRITKRRSSQYSSLNQATARAAMLPPMSPFIPQQPQTPTVVRSNSRAMKTAMAVKELAGEMATPPLSGDTSIEQMETAVSPPLPLPPPPPAQLRMGSQPSIPVTNLRDYILGDHMFGKAPNLSLKKPSVSRFAAISSEDEEAEEIKPKSRSSSSSTGCREPGTSDEDLNQKLGGVQIQHSKTNTTQEEEEEEEGQDNLDDLNKEIEEVAGMLPPTPTQTSPLAKRKHSDESIRRSNGFAPAPAPIKPTSRVLAPTAASRARGIRKSNGVKRPVSRTGIPMAPTTTRVVANGRAGGPGRVAETRRRFEGETDTSAFSGPVAAMRPGYAKVMGAAAAQRSRIPPTRQPPTKAKPLFKSVNKRPETKLQRPAPLPIKKPAPNSPYDMSSPQNPYRPRPEHLSKDTKNSESLVMPKYQDTAVPLRRSSSESSSNGGSGGGERVSSAGGRLSGISSFRSSFFSETEPSTSKGRVRESSRGGLMSMARTSSTPDLKQQDSSSTTPKRQSGASEYTSIIPKGQHSPPEVESEYSDEYSDEEFSPSVKRKKNDFRIPEWATTPELKKGLERQQRMNPDRIFGKVKPLRVSEIFNKEEGEKARRRARNSSMIWEGADALTTEEELKYIKQMGFED